jgi:DHA1 family inner membrane transport protein
MFTVFTYIVPILRQEAEASSAFVTAMLVLYGIGLTIGNWAGGRFADKSLDGTLMVALGGLFVLLQAFSVGMRWEIAAAPLIFATVASRASTICRRAGSNVLKPGVGTCE